MQSDELPIRDDLLGELGNLNPVIRENAVCKARALPASLLLVLLRRYLREKRQNGKRGMGGQCVTFLRKLVLIRFLLWLFSNVEQRENEEAYRRESLARLLQEVQDPVFAGPILTLLVRCEPFETTAQSALWSVLERLLPQVPTEEVRQWTSAQQVALREPLRTFSALFTTREEWPEWSSSVVIRQATMRTKFSEVALSHFSSVLICILEMIERCGDISDIDLVKPLTRLPARTQEETRLRYAASHCLALLEADAQAMTQAQSLLRPVDTWTVDQSHLLRPVEAQQSYTPANQLLRPRAGMSLEEQDSYFLRMTSTES